MKNLLDYLNTLEAEYEKQYDEASEGNEAGFDNLDQMATAERAEEAILLINKIKAFLEGRP
jgi:hypothetical protein